MIRLFLLSSLLMWATNVQAQDCNSVGLHVAQSEDGTLQSTQLIEKNGREFCVVVVIVPPFSKGEKPRRVELEVELK